MAGVFRGKCFSTEHMPQVTAGPGATNSISGVAQAYAASLPMVHISGDVPLNAGNEAFHGVDRPDFLHRMFADITKWSVRIERPVKAVLMDLDGTSVVLDSKLNWEATVTITVSEVADVQDDSVGTPEDTAVTIPVLANDTDADGNSLTAVKVTGRSSEARSRSVAWPMRVWLVRRSWIEPAVNAAVTRPVPEFV